MCVLQERVKLSKFASDKMRQRRLEHQDPTRRRTTHTLLDDVKGERSTPVTAITISFNLSFI